MGLISSDLQQWFCLCKSEWILEGGSRLWRGILLTRTPSPSWAWHKLPWNACPNLCSVPPIHHPLPAPPSTYGGSLWIQELFPQIFVVIPEYLESWRARCVVRLPDRQKTETRSTCDPQRIRFYRKIMTFLFGGMTITLWHGLVFQLTISFCEPGKGACVVFLMLQKLFTTQQKSAYDPQVGPNPEFGKTGYIHCHDNEMGTSIYRSCKYHWIANMGDKKMEVAITLMAYL